MTKATATGKLKLAIVCILVAIILGGSAIITGLKELFFRFFWIIFIVSGASITYYFLYIRD